MAERNKTMSALPERVLVVRLSAIGDVAMTVPVLDAVARQYPQTVFTFVSRDKLHPLFDTLPDNVHFIGVNDREMKHGLKGLNLLFGRIRQSVRPDAVADLHDVLRTQYLRFRFWLNGVRVASIDKGRREKHRLTRQKHKVLQPLQTSFQRYADVFRCLGFDIHSEDGVPMPKTNTVHDHKGKWIGIAPFAKHTGKIYPLALMEQVVAGLSAESGVEKILLFGGGAKETQLLQAWQDRYSKATNLAGRADLKQELQWMSELDVMVSMDSANMHLASLVEIPVVSIWGATHPYAGFMGWHQDSAHAVQVDLPCRPCSVFGNKPCKRHDYACLTGIQPDFIIQQIKNILRL